MYQLQTNLGETIPISLVLLTDGKRGWVVFIRTRQFNTIFDMSKEGICAVFDMDRFTIGEEEFEYNRTYAYKEIPTMLQWLIKQNLQMPLIREESM